MVRTLRMKSIRVRAPLPAADNKKSRVRKNRDFLKNGVGDGTRTHDNRNHNPGLYQLSYTHHSDFLFPRFRRNSAAHAPKRI